MNRSHPKEQISSQNERELYEEEVTAKPLAKNHPVTPHLAQLHPANLLRSICKRRLKRKINLNVKISPRRQSQNQIPQLTCVTEGEK